MIALRYSHDLFSRVSDLVRACLVEMIASGDFVFEGCLDDFLFTVEPPRDVAHGELASNVAMVLARSVGLAPRVIAAPLAARLLEHEDIDSVNVAGAGFINMTLVPDLWRRHLDLIIMAGDDYGWRRTDDCGPINLEYVSANPTGPLHVGHVRGAVYGDVLARLLTATGHEVVREYYVNDAGVQIEMLVRSIAFAVEHPGVAPPEGYYHGAYIDALAGETEAGIGGDGADHQIASIAVDYIMTQIRRDLFDLGVSYDIETSERSLQGAGCVDSLLVALEAGDYIYRGVLPCPKGHASPASELSSEDSEGDHLLFKSHIFGDDMDRALQKSDGSWTYFANDAAYHLDKYRRGFHEMINVWGADHGGYVSRVQAVLSALTDPPARLDVKLCQMVRLLRDGKLVKMSKRLGNFITLRELLDEVGCDAIRFMMLTRKNDAPLDFDYAVVKSKTHDNPVFYVQYAHARLSSALLLAVEAGFDITGPCSADMLTHPAELGLIRTLARFPRMLEAAARAREPHRIAFYLRHLAGEIHALWSLGREDPMMRFIRPEAPEVTQGRITLLRAARQILRNGLTIMGVTSPDEMR